MKRVTIEDACGTKLTLRDRPLLTPIQAGGLAAVFKVLANDTRLRLLHALVRAEELCVTDLAASLGMKPQAVSNQCNASPTWVSSPPDATAPAFITGLWTVRARSLLDQALCLMEEVTARNRGERPRCVIEKCAGHCSRRRSVSR